MKHDARAFKPWNHRNGVNNDDTTTSTGATILALRAKLAEKLWELRVSSGFQSSMVMFRYSLGEET